MFMKSIGDQSDQGVTRLVIKPYPKNSAFKVKKMSCVSKPPFTFHLIF